eukprot:TRINITY_DN1001_c0_g1_i1.p1 TRINITY_DN1001_c0_g1~~TRINITY_DN1001_c0_g1_i1.p1  ORF type:complete len:158 (+),score=24.27 TRINITY_DN1001_c0_g1_i1:625-1098(+)
MIGCGNSIFSEELYRQGYKHITNIDFSETVIQKMQEKYPSKSFPEMSWKVMDCTKMTLKDGTFDICLDKGTLDAILGDDNNKWELEEDAEKSSRSYFSEVIRVLKPEGAFVHITFVQEHFRQLVLKRKEYDWNMECHCKGDSGMLKYHIYIDQKSFR